jgi:hypothetical protein
LVYLFVGHGASDLGAFGRGFTFEDISWRENRQKRRASAGGDPVGEGREACYAFGKFGVCGGPLRVVRCPVVL